MPTFNTQSIEGAIRAQIQKDIEAISEEECQLASEKIKKRIKERVSLIATTVMSRVSMEAFGAKGLKIVIDFNDDKPLHG